MNTIEKAWQEAAEAWSAVVSYIDNYDRDRYDAGPGLDRIESLKAEARAKECLARAEMAKSPETPISDTFVHRSSTRG